MKITQICLPALCDCEPIEVPVGNKVHTFCCQKGFEQSLKDFQEHVNKLELKRHQHN